MHIIAAVNIDWGIGYNNTQSIVIPEDRRRFKKLTNGGTVIAGRKTFEDIGIPLPNRKNIILTRDKNYMPGGVLITNSVEEILAITAGEDPDKVFVIGGGSIYSIFLPMCSHAHITKIEAMPLSDTFFPNLDKSPDWSLVTPGEPNEWNGITYSFNVYRRNYHV